MRVMDGARDRTSPPAGGDKARAGGHTIGGGGAGYPPPLREQQPTAGVGGRGPGRVVALTAARMAASTRTARTPARPLPALRAWVKDPVSNSPAPGAFLTRLAPRGRPGGGRRIPPHSPPSYDPLVQSPDRGMAVIRGKGIFGAEEGKAC